MSKKRDRYKSKNNSLESKVIKFRALNDEGGQYIPYCNYGHHIGVVLRPEVCTERKCFHYLKLYLILGEKPYKRKQVSQ
jgi:hypothetical protein